MMVVVVVAVGEWILQLPTPLDQFLESDQTSLKKVEIRSFLAQKKYFWGTENVNFSSRKIQKMKAM